MSHQKLNSKNNKKFGTLILELLKKCSNDGETCYVVVHDQDRNRVERVS